VKEYDLGSVVVPKPGTKPICVNSELVDFLSIANPLLFVSVAVVQFS
jgi:hypothetical protein